MGQSDQALDRLNELLHALPGENMPMTLSELDGYVTGILACSEMIAPSEWLPKLVPFACEYAAPTNTFHCLALDLPPSNARL